MEVTSIESVLSELGIDYSLSGDEAIASCPAHNDRHPSWSLNVRTGVHNCFSCGFSGSLAQLVSHVLDLSYTQAVLWVNSRVGWARAHKWREDCKAINFSPQKLKVSYADMVLFTDPPSEALQSRNLSWQSCKALGIRWNPVNETWIAPVKDPHTHELWGWQAKNERTFRNYPAGIKRSKTLFGLEAFNNGSPAILVESPLDCARLYTAGKHGGLASYGVSVSDRQLSLIQQRTELLILSLDNDSAGVERTARICKEFSGVKTLRIFNYGMSNPLVKDLGEMNDEEIQIGIENAIPAIRWYRNVYGAARHIPAASGR